MFKGAELEYLLCGSEDEIMNQLAAFLDLYLFRFAVDALSSLTNEQVQAMCEGTYIAGIVIMLIVLFLEPFIDCIMLVNGIKEYFYKETVYLTPSGIVSLVVDAIKLNSITSGAMNIGGLGDKLTNFAGNGVAWSTIESQADNFTGYHDGEGYDEDDFYEFDSDTGKMKLQTKKKGIYSMDYTLHMFYLINTRVTPDALLQRIQDIIYTEAVTYNNLYSPEVTFDLNKAYTGIQTEMTYEAKPMFTLDALSGSDSYAITNTTKMHD